MNTTELRKALDEATPAPWQTPGPNSPSQWVIYDAHWTVAEATAYPDPEAYPTRPDEPSPAYIDADANAHLIVLLRNNAEALFDVMEAALAWADSDAQDIARHDDACANLAAAIDRARSDNPCAIATDSADTPEEEPGMDHGLTYRDEVMADLEHDQ